MVTLSGHSSTWQLVDVAVHGKATQYSFGVGGGNGVSKVMDQSDRLFFSKGEFPSMLLPTMHHTPYTQPSGSKPITYSTY